MQHATELIILINSILDLTVTLAGIARSPRERQPRGDRIERHSRARQYPNRHTASIRTTPEQLTGNGP